MCGSSNQQKCVLLSCWTASCRRSPAAFQAGQAKGNEAVRDSHPAGWHTQRMPTEALDMGNAVEAEKVGETVLKSSTAEAEHKAQ